MNLFTDIYNDAKDLAMELRKLADENSNDLNNVLNDFVYAIENTYQTYYNPEANNYR